MQFALIYYFFVLVIFPTKADGLSYEIFARRMGSTRSNEFKEVLSDIMKGKRYCMAVVDLHPASDSKFMVWSKMMPNETPVGYVID